MASFQIISDLHLEFSNAYDAFEIKPTAPYLALLGDIGVAVEHREGYLRFLSRQLQHFQVVLLVPGNHEAYGSSWVDTLRTLKDFEQEHATSGKGGKFILLDRCTYILPSTQAEKTVVLGCSLFSHVPQAHAMNVELRLADFFKTTPWSVKLHNEAHNRDLAWLNAQVQGLEHDSDVANIIIFSHWSPTLDPRGTDSRHQDSPISSAFATDLSQEMCSASPKVVFWAFGHTHYNCDFTVKRSNAGPVRYYTNQRGYAFTQAEGYHQERVICL